MPNINSSHLIPDEEIFFDFIRSSGPGGQNVNKVATGVQLRFNIRNSPSLTEEIKDRLVKLAGKKVTKSGEIVIEARRFRSQEMNRTDAVRRFEILISKALVKPKKRLTTRPTPSSKKRRIETKNIRSELKRQRRMIDT